MKHVSVPSPPAKVEFKNAKSPKFKILPDFAPLVPLDDA